MSAWYNEIDPFAADWLENLIAAGHIAPGVVDRRDIRDVRPDDLAGFTQHHFFAGIAVWSLALRNAGWPDDREVWTGSCPCQPFSAAGKRGGVADERHLWPEFFRLIRECRPAIAFGEQVASKDGLGWLDAVQTDMEAAGYAFGAADMCAAGIGAPHIRQRLWWTAVRLGDPCAQGLSLRERPSLVGAWGREEGRAAQQPGGASDGLADADRTGRRPGQRDDSAARYRNTVAAAGDDGTLADRRGAPGHIAGVKWGEYHQPRPADGGLGDAERLGAGGNPRAGAGAKGGAAMRAERYDAGPSGATGRPGPVNGFWRDADWLHCRDGKWRPVEPETSPLAPGIAGRVGRLRAYGNAIVEPVARAWIEAVLDTLDDRHLRVEDLFA